MWVELTDGVRLVHKVDLEGDAPSLAVVGDVHKVGNTSDGMAGREQQQTSRGGLSPDVVLAACLSTIYDGVDVNLGGVIRGSLDGQGGVGGWVGERSGP